MKVVLTAAKPQQVLLMEENGYVFLDGKWISCDDIICERRERMTIAELHEILDDKNKKITLKEYQEILFQLKWDVQNEICKLTKEDVTHPKLKWYYGEMNGFQLALDLSEHIKEVQDDSVCDKK